MSRSNWGANDRDHFAAAWSATLSGCGVRGGACFGKTDDDGHKVADGEVGLTAVGAKLAHLHLGCVDVEKLLAGAPARQ